MLGGFSDRRKVSIVQSRRRAQYAHPKQRDCVPHGKSRAKSEWQENRQKETRQRSHGEPPAEFGESRVATARAL